MLADMMVYSEPLKTKISLLEALHLVNTHWILRCEFPDDDQVAYVIQETLMGKHPKIFQTKDAAEKYARENFPDCVYNIEEIKGE
jgi:hypothetical protein